MKLEIDIPSIIYNDAKENRGYISVGKMEIAWKAIADGKPLEQEPKSEWEQDHAVLKAYSDGANEVLDKIRAEIKDLTYYCCEVHPRYVIEDVLKILDKYKAESKG